MQLHPRPRRRSRRAPAHHCCAHWQELRLCGRRAVKSSMSGFWFSDENDGYEPPLRPLSATMLTGTDISISPCERESKGQM